MFGMASQMPLDEPGTNIGYPQKGRWHEPTGKIFQSPSDADERAP